MKKLNNTDYRALNYILYNKAVTRTELSKFLDISQAAVCKIVKKLDSLNLLSYEKSKDSRVKNNIKLNKDFKKIIGVYVCINYLEICVCDLVGNILEVFTYKMNNNFTQKEKTKRIILNKIQKTIDIYKKENIVGIGFSIQADINSDAGILIKSDLLKEENIFIEKFFYDKFKIDCIVENHIHSMLYTIDLFQHNLKNKLLYYKKNDIQGISFMVNDNVYKGSTFKMSNFENISLKETIDYINLLDIENVILNIDEVDREIIQNMIKCNNVIINEIENLEKLSPISLIINNLFKNKKLIQSLYN
ncbi:MAG: ROK family transcriptional regulator [Oceanivirga sp.]|nr:ROK family transcriptional regulator [Oceanivirga sp.]